MPCNESVQSYADDAAIPAVINCLAIPAAVNGLATPDDGVDENPVRSTRLVSYIKEQSRESVRSYI